MRLITRLALRSVATVLVLFGVGCTKKSVNDGPPAAPPAPSGSSTEPAVVPVTAVDAAAPEDAAIVVSEKWPERIDERAIRRWIEHQSPQSPWTEFKKQAVKGQLEGSRIAGAPPVFEKVFTSTGPIAADDAIVLLDKAENDGLFDHWLAAYLWRRTTSPSAAFYARIQEHARVTDALVLARGRVKPANVSPNAWKSKAGPSVAERTAWSAFIGDIVKTAKEEYPRTQPGTWKKDGTAILSPVDGTQAPSIIQGGATQVVGTNTRFGRLDLLVTPKDGKSAVSHAWLGRVDLPAATTISVWSLDTYLGDEAKKKVRTTLDAALAGDEKAALELERAMPFVHDTVRSGVSEKPRAKGAPRLRTILALFDDVPMSPPVEVKAQGDVGY